MASTKETISGVPQPAGMELALPALDAEILTAVRALNRYPKRGKDKTQDLLAMRIAKKWLDLLPSTREKLQELRNFAQEHERLLANKFSKAKHLGKLSSSQIQELKAIWASNSGDKHPVVTMAQGSSEGGRGIKRQCEEGHAEPNSGGEHSAVTKRMTHASCGYRR